MQLFLVVGLLGAVALGAWKLYAHGYDVAELSARASSAQALQVETERQASLARKASAERLEAEKRAVKAEINAENQAAALVERAGQETKPECPEICYAVPK